MSGRVSKMLKRVAVKHALGFPPVQRKAVVLETYRELKVEWRSMTQADRAEMMRENPPVQGVHLC